MPGRDEGKCIAQSLKVGDMADDGRKRKTTEETVSGGQLFAPLIAELAKNKKAAADGAASPEKEVAAEDAAVGDKPKARMSEREIRQILSRKPMTPPRHYEALKESHPDLTPLPGEEMDEDREGLFFRAKLFYCVEERYPKMQAWIREELATKGYVEMDDDWVRRRAEAEQALEEGWKEIEKKIEELQFSEDDFDYGDDDDDSDYYDDEDSGHGRDNNNNYGEDEEK